MHELMLKPEYRIGFALQTNQLIQQSLQNVYNAAAQKPPAKLAELQAKLAKLQTVLVYSANKANMTNQFVPNYAAAFQPMLNSLFSGMQRRTEPEKAANYSHPAGPEQGVGAPGLLSQ